MPAVMRGIVNRIRMREARTKHEEGAEEQRQERRCSDACARIDRILQSLERSGSSSFLPSAQFMPVTMGRDKPHGQFGLEFDCVCRNSSQGPCFVSAILGCFPADIDGKAEIKCVARR